MLIRRFIQWSATATAEARAQATSALARAFAAGELEVVERQEAETALTALLDDPAPIVRLAMAIELCTAPSVPRPLLAGLMADRSDIACIILEFSPAPSVAELVDAVAVGDAQAQAAVARRMDIDARLAAALAEVAGAEACLELCRNTTAQLPGSAVARMVERFADHKELRSVLAARDDLPAAQRFALTKSTADDLAAFAVTCGWLDGDRAARVAADATEQACVTIAATSSARRAGTRDQAELAAVLRQAGALTAALLLRAALSGGFAFLGAALAELSGMPIARVAGLLRASQGLGFRALFDRAGLPPSLRPVFVAALDVAPAEEGAGRLQRPRIAAALAVCERAASKEGLKSVATLLRRFDADAARSQARAFTRDVMNEPVVIMLPRPTQADRCLPLSSAA